MADYLNPLSDDDDDVVESSPMHHHVNNLILSDDDLDAEDLEDLVDEDDIIGEDLSLRSDGETQVPEVIKNFIIYFHRHLTERNVHELHAIYEQSFPKLSEKFYKQHSWPAVALIAPLVSNDEIFLMLYRELWFRHLYASLKVAEP